jgi:type II secretory pathway component HofQ
MKHTLNPLIAFGLLLSIGIHTMPVTASGPMTVIQLRVDIQHQRLSVQADRAPLNPLLTEVADRSGIEIYLQGETEEKVSVDLRNVGLEQGLKRLLRGINHAFTYGHDASGRVVIEQLYVYSKTGEGKFKRIRQGVRRAVVAAPQTAVEPRDGGAQIYPQTPKAFYHLEITSNI